jgi:hypothetical protein
MPPPLPEAKVDAIKALLEQGLPCNIIAMRETCSAEIVRRIKRNIINYGTPGAPKLAQQGRKPLITPEMAQVHRGCCNVVDEFIGSLRILGFSIDQVS